MGSTLTARKRLADALGISARGNKSEEFLAAEKLVKSGSIIIDGGSLLSAEQVWAVRAHASTQRAQRDADAFQTSAWQWRTILSLPRTCMHSCRRRFHTQGDTTTNNVIKAALERYLPDSEVRLLRGA